MTAYGQTPAVSPATKAPTRTSGKSIPKPTAKSTSKTAAAKKNITKKSNETIAPLSKAIVSKIIILGQKKIEQDAIKAKLKTKIGETLDAENIRTDVQSIFDMGYFYNVEVDRNVVAGQVEITFKVTEKPSVVEVVYKGNDRVDHDDLQEASGIKQYTILDHNKLREAVDKMQKVYEDKGFFLARVQYKVEELKGGAEARVTFNIKENDKVKVKKVTFLGNKNLPDSKLKAFMQTQEGGFFSFISSSGSYKQDLFDRDVSVLNYVYFNEGYIQVKIDRPQVYVTPDKKSIYITIRIEEGDQFRVGKVDFGGDLLFTKDELYEATDIQKTDIFSSETLKKDIQALQFKYGDLGYAFANPIPKTNIHEKDKTVDITFEIEKGQKVYFGQFTVTGNTKTRDKVVRRELMIKEGELYNETRRKKSEEGIKRLGFFSDVIFNTSTPPDNPNIMNVEIQVKERSTGTLQVGAGYSTAFGALFNASVSQTNLFGKGQYLSLNIQVSQNLTDFRLGLTEPYFNDTLWSAGGDLFYTRGGLITTYYMTQERGLDLRMGHPLTEDRYLNAYLTYKFSNSEVFLTGNADPTIFPTWSASGYISSVTGSIVYDKRNDRWIPTNGFYSSLAVEQAGLGGDLRFTKALANFRYYKEIFWKLVFRNNLTYGNVLPPSGGGVPFNQLFLLGGAQSMRGFSYGMVGLQKLAYCCQTDGLGVSLPLNSPTLIPFGGTQELFNQMEIEIPLVAEAQIKGVLFYDVGMADSSINLGLLRQDLGFGIRWISPIGPLRFEWGFPLARQPNDLYSNFEFSIGAPF